MLLAFAGPTAATGVTAHAAPGNDPPASAREAIPPPLQPWIPWVLHGHEEAFCPVVPGATPDDANTEDTATPNAARALVRACLWPSRLELSLDDRGGRFAQDWQVFRDAWVGLPGDGRSWPQDVHIDGRAAPVTTRDGKPSVRLGRGRHRVEGRFAWPALPSMLPVPGDSALLALSVRGRGVEFPVRDGEGRVWLEKQAGADEEESRLDVAVHRLLDDDVPPLLLTRIELRVSGRGREANLGRPLPPGFTPMALTGPLPARLAADGRLLAQVRPGTWTLELLARHDGPLQTVTPPPGGGPWPKEEAWVVQARPAIRVVKIEGLQSLDPQQTTLPDDWRALPAYLMRAGDTLKLVEVQRGDADPAPDQLTLQRALWLDFDGGGLTAHDAIHGRFTRAWRLEMAPPGRLGRVAMGNVDQLITRGSKEGVAGVEVRQGEADVTADSRWPRGGALPATGWDTEFQGAVVDLKLPPGWRILHATGADETRSTWVASWNLLDLFLVLLISMGAARLFGWNTLWLALGALGLSWIEPHAPRWTWAAAVAASALAAALPHGRIKLAARLLQGATIVALLPILIPFLVMQARSAMYPALEPPMSILPIVGSGGIGSIAEGVQEEQFESAAGGMIAGNADALRSQGYAHSRAQAPQPESKPYALGYSSNLAPDPKAATQTGPGLPEWQWRSATLRWSGPVVPGQNLRLWLLPPWLNFFLAWVRIALLIALLLLIVASAGREWGTALRLGPLDRIFKFKPATATVVVMALLLMTPAARAADVPPADALDSLRARLLEAPDCLPDCVSFPRLALEADPDRLRLRLELHAAALVAVPLPGGVDQWLPGRASLDDGPAPLRRDDAGRLWIALSPGTHHVLLEGALPDVDTVPISLPLPPREVSSRASGWRVEGIQEGRLAEGTLQLSRIRTRAATAPPRAGGRTGAGAAGRDGAGTAGGAPSPETLAPFVRVSRQIELGLRWQVTTEVTRVTPAGTALLIEVPLLPGESVTSADVPVIGDQAVVRLGPDATGATWTSVLLVKPELVLRAPPSVVWTEHWKVAAGPVWHVEAEGPAPIHEEESGALRSREWRPWPGEEVRLTVRRPAPVEGPTLTIDRTERTLLPGLRATDVVLDLSVRSSRGGEQTLTLPEGAVLGGVTIQGRSQPYRQSGATVTLPIVPGAQQLRLAWREPRGLSPFFRVAGVTPGVETTNARTVVSIPADRWILFLHGPRLGPAVLFWSLLVVSLLASLLLGSIRTTPLRWYHWFGLSFGLTQIPIAASLVIVGWLLALGLRRRPPRNKWVFDLTQLALAFWTVVALGLLFWAIQHGLLGRPEMQIDGNGSSAARLAWYQDRTTGALPQPWVFSVPILFYRLAMLGWALWLAAALVRWLRWGWDNFSEGGVWMPLRRPKPDVAADGPADRTPPSPAPPGLTPPPLPNPAGGPT
ncbi:MAG TPA: hypothetical protein VFQ07_06435 [Candidatus Polarisedimenticolia bacterium]|nr:hypothetical protein [Candidatus Polarisedimenticolia bacterium]